MYGVHSSVDHRLVTALQDRHRVRADHAHAAHRARAVRGASTPVGGEEHAFRLRLGQRLAVAAATILIAISATAVALASPDGPGDVAASQSSASD